MDSENVSRATFHKIRLNLFPIQLGNTKLGHTSTRMAMVDSESY